MTRAAGGRGALEAAIKTRIAEKAFNGGLYLLADQNFKPVAGDLDSWPHELSGASGFGNFGAPDTGGRSSYRALIDTLPDNSHLLVGRNAEDLESFKRTIDTALAFTLLLIAVLAGVVSILVTRPDSRPHRIDQCHKSRHHGAGSCGAYRTAWGQRRMG